MKKKLLSLLVAATIGATTPAFAAENSAVLKRLDQLEAQRKADQSEIQALRNKVQQLEMDKPAAVSSSEAAQLREEIIKVEKKATSRIESTKKSIESEREKLRINGYMSVYGVKSTNKAVQLTSGVDNHIGFNSDTIAGVQFDYKLDENLNAVVQLRAEGRNDYEVETPWAFLRYKITPSTTIRAGRMVSPLYLYADSIDVGFTYPWVRPPVEMYGTDSLLYTGIDLIQNFSFADWDNNVQITVGDGDGQLSGNHFTTDYQAGLFATFNHEAWTLRAGGTRVENLTPLGADPFADTLDYLSASLRYDNGALLVLAEARRVKSGEKLEVIIPSFEAFYTTVGYQIDKFMPYATWTKVYSTDEPAVVFGQKQSQESVGLGLRYNLTDKVVIKGEATKYRDFDGTPGATGMVTLPAAGGALNPANQSTLDELDKNGATVMSLGVDAAF